MLTAFAMQVGVPLLYPVLAFCHLLGKVLVTYLLTSPSTSEGALARIIRGLGARPARSFKMRMLYLSYLPPALFYFNTYYYSAVGYCLAMLQCTPASGPDAPAHLIAAPEIKCWEGDHIWLATVASVLLILYLGGIGCIYVRLLFSLLPTKGLDDPLLAKLFGFVYLRFEDKYYCEICRSN
eukprot:3009876-Prymnesium_polylepis.3